MTGSIPSRSIAFPTHSCVKQMPSSWHTCASSYRCFLSSEKFWSVVMDLLPFGMLHSAMDSGLVRNKVSLGGHCCRPCRRLLSYERRSAKKLKWSLRKVSVVLWNDGIGIIGRQPFGTTVPWSIPFGNRSINFER